MLAESIRLATDSVEKDIVHKGQLLMTLVPKLKKDNPNFEGFTFLEACGLEPSQGTV